MSLANIQHAFMFNLLQSQDLDADFLSELSSVGALTKEKQLSIYRSNINGAHQKVLGMIYPACKNILGEDYFNQLCALYRFENPSTNADLNVYGEQFPYFLKKQIYKTNELSGFEYLVDLALLEWNWHASYFANDDHVFNFEQLASIDEEKQNNIVFSLSHSLSVHSTAYPVLEIWQANRNAPDEEQEFLLPESKVYFCIARKNNEVLIEELTEYQFSILRSIADGLTLSQLMALEMEYDDMQTQLLAFIQKGWVTDFSLPDKTKATQE